MGNAKQSNQTLIIIFLQFCGHNPDCFNILIEMVNHKSQHRLQKLAIEVDLDASDVNQKQSRLHL